MCARRRRPQRCKARSTSQLHSSRWLLTSACFPPFLGVSFLLAVWPRRCTCRFCRCRSARPPSPQCGPATPRVQATTSRRSRRCEGCRQVRRSKSQASRRCIVIARARLLIRLLLSCLLPASLPPQPRCPTARLAFPPRIVCDGSLQRASQSHGRDWPLGVDDSPSCRCDSNCDCPCEASTRGDRQRRGRCILFLRQLACDGPISTIAAVAGATRQRGRRDTRRIVRRGRRRILLTPTSKSTDVLACPHTLIEAALRSQD